MSHRKIYMDFCAKRSLAEKQIEKLHNNILGRNNSFLPFITDENGAVTDARLESFIKEISDSYFSSVGYSIKKDFIEMCECFLYCTIQGFAEYNEIFLCVERRAEFFYDITDIIGNELILLVPDIDKLQEYEYEIDYEVGSFVPNSYVTEFQTNNFLRCSDEAYRIITGKSIVSTFSAERRDELEKAYLLQKARKYGYDTIEEYFAWRDSLRARDEARAAEQKDNADDTSHEEDFSIEELEDFWMSEEAEAKRINEQWLETVVSPEKFAAKYLRFRELFSSVDNYYLCDFHKYIQEMVDFFIYKQGLTVLTDDNTAALTDRRIEKLYNSVIRR